MANQRERILSLLEERGELGVLNLELNEIAFRYGARLKELRDEGYQDQDQAHQEVSLAVILMAEGAA
jgi:hypothetical protein